MNLLLRVICLPLLLCSLLSCSLLSVPTNIVGSALSKLRLANAKQKEKALEVAAKNAAKEPKEQLSANAVGEVSYVDEESGFILIRQASGQQIVPSTALLSKNPTGSITAKLMSSAATKGSFVAADIISGNPERGNPVHLDPDATTKAQNAAKPLQPAANLGDDAPGQPRQAPKLEPILPPLNELRPPSDAIEAPAPPLLPQ